MKLTSRRRAKHKWYDITAYFMTQVRFLTEIIFSFFDSVRIVSAYRFRNACACLIFIELFINKTNLHSSFFSSLSVYKLICADAKVISLVYYKAFVRWLYVDSENFIEIWCSLWDCVRTCGRCRYISARNTLRGLLCRTALLRNIKS